MRPDRERPGRLWVGHLFVSVVVLMFGLSSSVPATVLASSPSREPHLDEHSQYCRCGPRCLRTCCCCGPRDVAPRPITSSESQHRSGTSSTDMRACISCVPCGDRGLPPPSAKGTLAGNGMAITSCQHESLSLAESFLRFEPLDRSSGSSHVKSRQASKISHRQLNTARCFRCCRDHFAPPGAFENRAAFVSRDIDLSAHAV